MGAFLSYSLESGLLMLALFLGYRIFLARENQHSYNRIVLLLIYLVSFATLPTLNFFQNHLLAGGTQHVAIDGMEIVAGTAVKGSKPLWGTLLIWAYMAGMSVVFIRTIITWNRIIKVVRAGEKIACGKCILVLTCDERLAPFSWLNYIVISRADYELNRRAIVAHEMKHIACHHWVDLLIAQAVCIVNWFNPAAWLMRDELMLVHEYQADLAVINSGHNLQEYQILLIKKAVGARFPSLANSLNHSKLKKRITMMYKEKSGAGPKFKVLALVPVLALALLVAAVPSVRAAVSTISSSSVSAGEDSENATNSQAGIKVFKVMNLNNKDNLTTVTIKATGLGNDVTVSGGTFTTMGKTYQAKSLECNMTNGEATIMVTFPFMDEWENSSMTLNVNGEEIPFDLENFINNPETAVAGTYKAEKSATSQSSIIVSGKPSNSLYDMEIYIDGQKVSQEEMENLEPGKIQSITIDQQTKSIKISLKK